MINPGQLLRYVIRPTLKDLGLWSEPAERLILGTACQESECGRYLVQIGGPALSIYQIEPTTHLDIHINFLAYRDDLHDKIAKYGNNPEDMITNLAYATAICRVHYLRVPAPIPDTLAGQAQYWKSHYNSDKGAGTVYQYLNAWDRFVTPDVLN